MQLLLNLLLLISAATAIDVVFHEGEGCTGAGIRCTNFPPNTDCVVPAPPHKPQYYNSMRFAAVPQDWFVTGEATWSRQCDAGEVGVRTWNDGGGKPGTYEDLCAAKPVNKNRQFACGHWWFHGKRRRGEVEGTAQVSRRAPDVFTSEDGTWYDIGHLDEVELVHLVGSASNGTFDDALAERLKMKKRSPTSES